jgi:hypothetical protein
MDKVRKPIDSEYKSYLTYLLRKGLYTHQKLFWDFRAGGKFHISIFQILDTKLGNIISESRVCMCRQYVTKNEIMLIVSD